MHYEHWKSRHASWLYLEPEHIQGYKKSEFIKLACQNFKGM